MPRRIAQLLIGLFLYGIGIAFIVRSALGAAPWDVLTQGITRHVPLSFGVVTTIVSGIVLLLWIPIRQRLGVGTVVNAVAVGPSADVGFLFIPEGEQLWQQILLFAIGLMVLSAATGLYIGAHFGPGPRDGLMTGLHQRLGRPIWLVRTCLEVTVVVIGWALGGLVGVGTVLFALLVGPLCQFFLRIFAVPIELRPARTRED
ncbi:membrane protein YczE [Microbacterium sp. USHLN186]|uniref:membrane protein YczE n=1 Tax=Microbacterium sp. USHLN186 TaxID=3081286 RepID=UPI00301A025A